MKLLITGFDPFGGESINPAFEAIKALPDKIENCEVIKQEIPTVFGRSLEVLEMSIKKHEPDVVICVGQAGGRFELSLEKVGINLNEARIPDNDGNQPLGSPIHSDGETAYFSTLPLKGMLKSLHEESIPAGISYTAGTYVCNHVLYGLMHMVNNMFPQTKGGFIHVPFLPQQVIDKRNMPSMSLDMITKGLETCIAACAKYDADIQYPSGQTH